LKRIALIAVLIAPLALPAATQAAVHTRTTHVLGHRVRIVRWMPGDGTTAHVTWSPHHHTVPDWAAAWRRNRNVAAMNGGTWTWNTGRPSGLLVSNGRRISLSDRDRPAVGISRSGDLIFGGHQALRHHARNIVAGEAYLIWKGVPIRRKADAPYTAAAAFGCGPRGTDGANGCYRSNIVRFRGGRVGLVEIAFATMPQAARVLMRLHVTDALTLDSGGSANLWTRSPFRTRSCADQAVFGSCFGIATGIGSHWERPVPDAIVVTTRR
jgi:hypothetical protein